MADQAFIPTRDQLLAGVELLLEPSNIVQKLDLPSHLPQQGIGDAQALQQLAPMIIGGAQKLGGELAFAHMDPPTPWVSWVSTFWNAALNQNLLHPDVSPVAQDVEKTVVNWLAPYFGMQGGHMTTGSTLANLTALWAARETKSIKKVVASADAHISIKKAANLLGLNFVSIASDKAGRLATEHLPDNLHDAALVLTAGTTSVGAIDPLTLCGKAAWTHIDAAWAGPLAISPAHAVKLAGTDKADSVAVSAHKWLFQPKESALVLFADVASAHTALSFGGAYLSTPNVGVLGSHSAVAVPLLATLLAWGVSGLVQRLDSAMQTWDDIRTHLQSQIQVQVHAASDCGVLLWRMSSDSQTQALLSSMPAGMASSAMYKGQLWIRQVAANPNINEHLFIQNVDRLIASVE